MYKVLGVVLLSMSLSTSVSANPNESSSDEFEEQGIVDKIFNYTMTGCRHWPHCVEEEEYIQDPNIPPQEIDEENDSSSEPN